MVTKGRLRPVPAQRLSESHSATISKSGQDFVRTYVTICRDFLQLHCLQSLAKRIVAVDKKRTAFCTQGDWERGYFLNVFSGMSGVLKLSVQYGTPSAGSVPIGTLITIEKD